jgi:3-oxoacyl-[acyl-carrier protein] reductase
MVKIDLNGQIAVVTGGGRGIGKSIALALAEQHATVILVARTEKEIQAATKQIILVGGSAEAKKLDISKEGEVISFFDNIVKKYGKLDILINNAGVNARGKLLDTSVAELDEVMKVNIRGTFLCCREGLRVMALRKKGYIINMSSVLGFRAYVDQAVYAASKHAVVGLTKTLAIEAKEHNVRVSLIHPGAVATEMGHSARPDLDPEVMIHPEDIAQVVLFLLSLSEHCAIDEIYIRRKSGSPF